MVRAITLSELANICPRCYEDLSLEQYQNLFSWDLDKEVHERDYFKLLCILSGQSFKEQNPTPEKEAAIYELTRWVNEQPFPYSKSVPKSVVIDSRTILIPTDLAGLSIGQNILLRQLLEKSQFIEDNLSMAVAIYLQPLFDSDKFDYDKAKELEKIIRKMPAQTIYPIGFFLLRRVMQSGWRRSKSLLRPLVSHARRLVRMWGL